MILRILAIGFWAILSSFSAAAAQEQTWVQIEALPSLKEAEDRAKVYVQDLQDVAGFQISAGWYAVTLGPFSAEEAAGKLSDYKRQGLIPRDSYITDGSKHRQQFWPVGQIATTTVTDAVDDLIADALPELAAQPEAEPEPAAEAVTDMAVEAVPAETLQQSRAAEAALSREERMELQEALAWYGYYDAKIDGAFGAGTRSSMAAWQEAFGFEPTGVLSSDQRGLLETNHRADLAEFGFEPVMEAEAGISITLPLALVQFDRYEPPFVHFSEKDGSGLQIILISEPGDKAALAGLYDVMQTLEVVPAEGERSLGDKSFTINASSDKVQSFAYAETASGAVKGYLVVWKPQDAQRMTRILPALQNSFAGSGSKVLDPGLVPMDAAARAGLLSGLEVKKPILSRSGFYVNAGGDVVTTQEAVAQCGRVTIDTDTDAEVLAQDAATGLAILRPKQALAPAIFAQFQTGDVRLNSEISVAGYSYEGRLPAPVLTFGALAEKSGLNGEAGISRLAVPLLPGDAGGPVLDTTGSVIGMVLSEAKSSAKVLPEGVEFAVQSDVIAKALTAAGISAAMTDTTNVASPDALAKAGMGMTVLVSCWE